MMDGLRAWSMEKQVGGWENFVSHLRANRKMAAPTQVKGPDNGVGNKEHIVSRLSIVRPQV